jgi:PmbA protein
VSTPELLDLAERVAAQARDGEQVEAYVSRGRETSVRVYEGEVEHLTSAESAGIGIRVVQGGRTGFAYAGTLDSASLAEVLAEARDNVGFGTVDEWAALAVPDGVAPPRLDLWNEGLVAASTDGKVALALELERLAASRDPRARVEDATYADGIGEGAVATSTGIRAYGRETACYVVASVLADGDGETQNGWAYSVGRNLDELDLEHAAGEAVDKAVRHLGATKPRSRRATLLLDPYVTAQFLRILSGPLNGESVLKGRSFFADRLGEVVASPLVTLLDDPTDPRAYTASEVDGEGLATRRTTLVEGGVLRSFVDNSYTARRRGTASTGNAVRGGFKGTPGCGCLAMQLVPGTRSQAELVAALDDAVLIDSVSGLHSGVNPVSGDFSTGATGLSISGGAIGAPLREFTIASTLQRMLQDVQEIGGDVAWLPMGAAGVSLVLADVTVSGS